MKKLSQENEQDIIMMYKANASRKEIAEKHNIHVETVTSIARKNNIPRRIKKDNLLHKVFERLTVVAEADNIKHKTAWKCKCSCGKHCVVRSEHLKQGHTKSCGCLNEQKRSERAYAMYSKNIKYSPIESSARRVWRKRYNDGISFEDFFELSQQNCYYCNSQPSNIYKVYSDDTKASKYKKENGTFIYNGLDRVDNTKNHNKDNVVSCCKWCNYAKRERTFDEFKQWIITVYDKII